MSCHDHNHGFDADCCKCPDPCRHDLCIEQGCTFTLSMRCRDWQGAELDLTEVTAAAALRYSLADPQPAAVFGTFVEGAIVTLHLTDQQTRDLEPRHGVWDCDLTLPNGDVQRLARGRVRIIPGVTLGARDHHHHDHPETVEGAA